MAQSPHLLLVGLEGAGGEALLTKQPPRGSTISRLAASGVRLRVEPAPPLASCPFWTTVATGMGADLHPVFSAAVPRPDGLGLRLPVGTDRARPTIWEIADADGVASTSIK